MILVAMTTAGLALAGWSLGILLFAALLFWVWRVLDRRKRERDRAEVALRQRVALYRSILSHFPNGAIFLLDRDLRYQLAEGTGLSAVGLSREALLGRTLRECFPASFYETREPVFEAALEGEASVSEAAYGGRIFRSHVLPMHGTDAGEITHVMVMSQDVTESRHAEEEIRRLNRELERGMSQLRSVNEELEAFTYSVSHDLRAPLRHIIGFVDMLGRGAANRLDEAGRRHLDVILGAARHMGQLIDDLLAFSRMARVDLMRQQVDLGRLVLELVAELQQQGREREVSWKVDGLPEVSGDRAMLRVVFGNLLSNALKYSRPRPHPQIEVGTVRGGPEEVVVFVRDNGVGFDMRYADKLFGVFQRLHGSDEFEGTGIGLATVRRIVNRHGGRCWGEGMVDAGATFYVALPTAAPPRREGA